MTAPSASDDFTANAQRVAPGLYLGSEDAAHCSLDVLQSHGIGAILAVGFGLTMKHKEKLRYHNVKAVDLPVFDILQFVPECSSFIEMALLDKLGCLVHCARGKSRSASIMIAYVMQKQRVSFEEAYAQVRKARPEISLNASFTEQLKLFARMKWELRGESAAHLEYRSKWSPKAKAAASDSKAASQFPRRIVFVRHGERADLVPCPATLEWAQTVSAPSRLHDPPLSAVGQLQAAQTADRLGDKKLSLKVARVFSSPYARALQTALPIAKHAGLTVCVEWSFSEFHLKGKPRLSNSAQIGFKGHSQLLDAMRECAPMLPSFEELRKLHREVDSERSLLAEDGVPGDGESRQECASRMRLALDHWLKSGTGDCIVVSHMSPIEFAVQTFVPEAKDFAPGFASVSIVEVDGDKAKLTLSCSQTHLKQRFTACETRCDCNPRCVISKPAAGEERKAEAKEA